MFLMISTRGNEKQKMVGRRGMRIGGDGGE